MKQRGIRERPIRGRRAGVRARRKPTSPNAGQRSSSAPLVVRGQEYASQLAAARALGVSRQRIGQLLKRERERAFGCAPKGRPKRPVTIGGTRFESRTDAARVLGLNVGTVSRWSKLRAPRRHIRLIIMDLETLKRDVRAIPRQRSRGPSAAPRCVIASDVADRLYGVHPSTRRIADDRSRIGGGVNRIVQIGRSGRSA